MTDDDGVRHRLWALPADGEGASGRDRERARWPRPSARPVTIADGHHRYETALRYRDERRMTRSCEEDPAFDYLLTLFLEATGEPLTVLPTHRLVRGIGDEPAAALLDARRASCSTSSASAAAETLVAPVRGRRRWPAGATGRFGLWTAIGGALLTARRDAFEPYPAAPAARRLRALDVTLLGVALERLAGIDADAVAAGADRLHEVGGRGGRARSSRRRRRCRVPAGGTPVASIEAVARDGDVMPQKSTYFYPKALTGLVINPHEW